nr:dolichol-phosphate mannose synthase subunit 3-like isoform X3 [Nicotiana tomentosiformis]
MSFWSMWNEFCGFLLFQMKQIVKILTIVFGVYALWIGLLQTSVVPESYTWLLPLYFIVSLGCYGLLMVGVGLMKFPTCPQEAVFLQQFLSLNWKIEFCKK